MRVSTLSSSLIYSNSNGKVTGLDYELAQQFTDYTIADSVAVNLFQRVHPELLALAFNVTDEQPVTWYSYLDDDQTLSAALLDFFNSIKMGCWRCWRRSI